jgi:dihydrofolate reductase
MSCDLCHRQDDMRITISEFISLDGVVQAPGGRKEDEDGGFQHGGWSAPFFDVDVMGSSIDAVSKRTDALLYGRRTYQGMAAAWPGRAGDPYADWINSVEKHVVSDTLSEADLTWGPATLIRGDDLVTAVNALRERPGGEVNVWGSAQLVRSLLEHDLVDELNLMIEPIVLGGGKSIFPTDGAVRHFELVSAATAKTGVQVCRYERVRESLGRRRDLGSRAGRGQSGADA